MIRAVAIILCLWASGSQGQTTTLSDGDRQAIQAVIADQLDAFQRDDGAAAFAQATPDIQAHFRTAANFMRMVREAYQPVYRPRQVEFRDVIDFHGAPAERVYLIGPDGVPVIALYPMERQPDGHWRINGCYLLRVDENSV
ncbi:MAG: DUF4864 domain-containing protein [Alphaproteobacteria bacterium]|jgi:ketosteroid isomerase-like protein